MRNMAYIPFFVSWLGRLSQTNSGQENCNIIRFASLRLDTCRQSVHSKRR